MTHAVSTVVCVIWTLAVWAAEPTPVSARVATLLNRLPHSTTRMSAEIVELPSGKVVYSRGARDALIPASAHKVVAAAVALDTLGPDYTFETRLEQHGPDLVLVGGGDPGFGDPNLAKERDHTPLTVVETWVRLLVQRQVTTVRDILIDDGAFESTWVHPTWEPEDLARWFAAPVGALNFNDNCIEVTVRPGAGAVVWDLFPPNTWVTMENRCRIGPGKPWIHRPPDQATYSLRGKCNETHRFPPVSVADPGAFAGGVLARALADNGVVVTGTVRRRPPGEVVTSGSPQFAIRATTPIADVTRRALTDSQNLFAECLLKAAGRSQSGVTMGSWEAGQAVAGRRLAEWGVDTRGMVIADGSGLSRANRLSAHQLVQVLTHMYHAERIGDVFIESLAKNNEPGTLRNRMTHLSGDVWAKSGYMSGIRSLCGYVRSADGRWYALAIIFNDVKGGTLPYTRLQDRVCRELAAP